MKRIGLWFSIGAVVVFGLAIYGALQMGERAPIFLAGDIELAPELTEKAVGIRTLFIVLYDANDQRPMPFGAVRETLGTDASGKFFHFLITPENLQRMPAASPRAPRFFRVKARLDRDGQGGMDTPGDLVGVADMVATGSQNVKLTIHEYIPK